ncbi:NgoMIV family type II restriction endonuclease [Streptomyces barkulensis]|uniref:NgoMIV family type II restriction endonuclease n=1 Tax=Streptomyces barkulensis TaxID=1257026 RepID=UPI001304373D|nr:NgoMIV family type II restriction endonuclease [Streptomyces barkulensis]
MIYGIWTTTLRRGDVSAPEWFTDLLAWKESSNKNVLEVCGEGWAPNISDVDNKTSVQIAKSVFRELGVERRVSARSSQAKEESRGAALENSITKELAVKLPEARAEVPWVVKRGEDVRKFEQYKHLAGLRELLSGNASLRVTLGTDYQIAPDVTVSVDIPGNPLHAVVSCKWTLRSDRAQNVRHEFNLLVRSRRGRAPHLVAITAEPLPSRLSSLTRGTGEIDAIYHLSFEETQKAVREYGGKRHRRNEPSQLELWEEMTGQNRLRDYGSLVRDLVRY